MGRNRYIEADELRKLAHRFLHEEKHGAGSKVKASEFVEYVQKNGYPKFQDFHLRKEPGRSIYNEIKGRKQDELTKTLVMHRPIDVDAFLETNRTPVLMRRALVQLDTKYKELADAALVIVNERNYTRSKINGLIEERDVLEEKLSENEKKLAKYKAKSSELEEKCLALSKFIKAFVYPEISNAIFGEDGLVAGNLTPHINMDYIQDALIRGNTAIFDQADYEPSEYNEEMVPDVPVCDEDGVVIEEDEKRDDKYVHLDFLKGGLF